MKRTPLPPADEALIAECYRRSLELLRHNLVPAGILAATPGERAAKRAYTTVFARDAAICALGMVASGEADLVAGAVAGLRTLATCQAANGQIPNYVRPGSDDADFWYTGCIDATLWWLLALRFCDAMGIATPAVDGPARERALAWLSCQEHPRWGLVQQNEASDWADIMPRSGFVLYANALWYAVKRCYGLAAAETTRDYANLFFSPCGTAVPEDRRARILLHYVLRRVRNRSLYLSFVNFSLWGEEGDVFGNLLAGLAGIADSSRSLAVVRALRAAGVDGPFPVRSVVEPIAADSHLWRLYMARYRQNYPWQYHNGGSWPMIGGFWILQLLRLGQQAEARRQLANLARANALQNWAFNEWLHGQSGEPCGMPGQSWNAALFVLARRALERQLPLFV